MPDKTTRRKIKKREQPAGIRDWDRLEMGTPTRDYGWSAERYREDSVDYTTDSNLRGDTPTVWNPRGEVLHALAFYAERRQDDGVLARKALTTLKKSAPAAGQESPIDRLVRDGWSYKEAAIRLKRATGADLPASVYRTVAHAAGKDYLAADMDSKRLRCSACGTVFGLKTSENVDLSCPHCKSGEVTTLDYPEQPQSTQRQYALERDNVSEYHGDNPHLLPVPASAAAVGDVIRKISTDETVKIRRASDQEIEGVSLRSFEDVTILADDMWQWELIGTRVDAEDLGDDDA